MAEQPEDKKKTFLEQLREKQENQRKLVEAVEDLHREQVRRRNAQIRACFMVVGVIGMMWYSFETIRPYVSGLWTHTPQPADTAETVIKKAETNQPKHAQLGVDAVLPSPRQESVVASFVVPLPAVRDDDAFYATFRTPSPEVAERFAMDYLATQAAAPTVESYHSVNQLPAEVVELNRLVELDKPRR